MLLQWGARRAEGKVSFWGYLFGLFFCYGCFGGGCCGSLCSFTLSINRDDMVGLPHGEMS